MFILVIYVLRTCRDYLFEYFINEVGATQGLRLALAFGHQGMSLLHGGVTGTCFRVRDSTRSNSHKIMV